MKAVKILISMASIIMVIVLQNGYAQKTYCTATVTNQPVTVSITSHPSDLVKCPGSSANFSVSLSGTTPYYYQWKKNGDTITGATSSSYSISSAAVSNEGMYTCSVRNLCRVITSNGAELKVINTSVTKIPNAVSAKVTFSWNKRTGKRYAIFVKQASTGSASPANNTTYTAKDTFGSGSQIGSSGWYCVYNDTGTSVTIKGLTPNTAYSAQVTEYTGTTGNEQYFTLAVGSCNPLVFTSLYATPTTQATSISTSSITSSSLTATWANGNGSNRVVFVKAASSGGASPVNNTRYTANTSFGSGTQIGSTGWYCVYNGTSNSVNISGLTSTNIYSVMVCEYNGSSGNEQYKTDTASGNPVNEYLIPSTSASNINFSQISTTSFSASWSSGNGSDRIVFISASASGSPSPVNHSSYSANDTFAKGSQIGSTGWYCIYKGSGSGVTVKGLTANTTYRVMVCEYNGTSGREKYNSNNGGTNPNNYYPTPTTQAHSISFSNYASTSFTASWTNGNGTSRAVFVSSSTTGTASPSNNTTYTANVNFGSGSQIASTGWYCVYNGTGTSVNIYGLASNTTYRVMVCDYNGVTSREQYITSNATNNPRNYYPIPTTQTYDVAFNNVGATSMDLSWANGNGSKRIVFMLQSNAGTANPSNYTTYTANTTFASGTQVGSSGWYCVYNGSGTNVSVYSLSGNTVYRVMVCEYNGPSSEEVYNLNNATNNPNNQTTDYAVPTTQASGISFNSITSSGYTATWTRGNGTNVAIFMCQGNSGYVSPTNNSTYNASGTFGSGSQVGSTGWFCVYNSTGTSIAISGLSPNTTYRMMACEYNGTSGKEKYNTNNTTNNPNNQTTDYAVPSTQATNISFSTITDSSFTASWTNGNGTSRAVFISSATTGSASPATNTSYTANTKFGSGSQIGATGWYCVYNGTGTQVIITGLSANSTYRVMICDYNGTAGLEKYNTNSATSNPNNQTTDYAVPSTQASGISFSNITAISVRATWTNGNGTSRAVFIKAATSGSASPVNNTSYTADTTYTTGSQIGTTGWYCVYNGSGTAVNISGLSPNTAYRLMVCDYNGTSGSEKYKSTTATNNPNNQTTDYAIPTTQATNISYSVVTDSSFTVSWTNGNGSTRAVFIKATNTGSASPATNTSYTANTKFGSGSQIGATGWYCVYNGTGTQVIITGLSANSTYRVMVCDYNGTAGLEKYNTNSATSNPNNQTTDYAVPSTQASGISFSNITAISVRATWTNGNGTSRAVFIKAATSGSASPVNNTSYTADTTYTTGSQIGTTGWYCVYNGSGTAVNISGLSPNTAYRLMVCDYNGTSGSEKYKSTTATNNPNNQTTDYAIPTTQATNISYSVVTDSSFTVTWTNGNGSTRAVFIKATNTGSASPATNTSYTANTKFGSGSQIGATGWYCVYNGTGTQVTLSGLSANSTYRVMVCEFNGTTGLEKYNTTSATNNPNNQTTDYAVPSSQANNISFSNVTATSLKASWSNGNGSKRIVFIKASASGTPSPVNNTSYTADTIYSAGSQIGTTGWYCVNNGTGTSVSVSGLSPNTTYQLMVCEYNGTTGVEKYNTATTTNNPNNQTTDYAVPTTQAINLSFSVVTDSGFTVSWTNGNGSSRAVYIKASGTGNPSPSNNTSYTANTKFGSGSQIGTSGWYCIYNGSGNSVSVYGLGANTTYRVMVCEYNGTSGKEKYVTTSSTNNPNNQTTDYATPGIQASAIVATSILASSFNLDWNKGNGTKCAVFIKVASSGSATPDNNTTYTANQNFGSGSQIRSTGWYCIYNGFDTFTSVSGLSPNVTYRVMVCEYNGSTGSEKYNSNASTNNPVNVLTDFIAPTTQASAIQVSENNTGNIKLNWTKGNGSKSVGFIKLAITGSGLPVNNTTYVADTIFGQGTQLGTSGWYCFHNGTATSARIYGLLSNKTYRVMIFEYNGTAGKEKYKTDPAVDNPLNVLTIPAKFNLTGGGQYCAGKNPTGVNIKLDSTEVGVDYQLLKNSVPTGAPVAGSSNAINWNDLTKGSYTVEASNTSGSIKMNGIIQVIENPLPQPDIQGLENEYCFEWATDTLIGTPSGGTFAGKGMTNNYFTPNQAGTGKHSIFYTYTDSKGCNNTDSSVTSVHLLTVDVNSPVIHCGEKAMLHATTTYSGSGSLTYSWLPVTGLNNSSIADPVATVLDTTRYKVNVLSVLGCSAKDSGIVYPVALDPIEICVVSVDTIAWKNKIMWVRPQNQGIIDGYNIYKEISSNTYSQIGYVPYNNIPQFIDINSKPEVHGDKYKITVEDSCSYESNPSFYHKTINLTIAAFGSTMGLNWDDYIDESGKYIPPMYYIYRGTSPSNMHLYDSVSGSFNSYNDINIFSVYYYMVGVIRDNCNDTSGNITKVISFSNKKDNSSLISPPTIQAKDIVFTNITSNSANYSFTRGNGVASVVLHTTGTTPYPPLVNDETYAKNDEIGSSGWYCVYNGTKNTDSLTKLTSGLHKVMVCEYNGDAGSEKYNTDPASNNPNSFTIVGVIENDDKYLLIYPNPFTQSTTISFPNESKQPYNLRIFDLSGKVVREIQKIRENQVVVMKGDLTFGMYYFELVGGEIFRGRFVVE